MKNIITILLLLAGTQCFAQRLQPILSYNENGYTLAEVERFARGSSPLSQKYQKELIRLVNKGLRENGYQIICTADNLAWIFELTAYKERKVKNFINSGRKGDSLEFYLDTTSFHGIFGVFAYKNCEIDLFKKICANLCDTESASYGQNPAERQPVLTSNPPASEERKQPEPVPSPVPAAISNPSPSAAHAYNRQQIQAPAVQQNAPEEVFGIFGRDYTGSAGPHIDETPLHGRRHRHGRHYGCGIWSWGMSGEVIIVSH